MAASKTFSSPRPSPVPISTLKTKFLRPASTSHFQCWFPPPVKVIQWIKDKKASGEIDLVLDNETFEMISLNCVDATLPGSTFATQEITDDFTGVTERQAYRRQYDDRVTFTFNVDHSISGDTNYTSGDYRVLLFFELWMQYVADEQNIKGLETTNYSYRMNYPDHYQSPYVIINKFEKDYNGNMLQYKLHQAYPISVDSIPVSYESSQTLQCVVSMNYSRYTLKTHRIKSDLKFNTPAENLFGVFPAPPAV